VIRKKKVTEQYSAQSFADSHNKQLHFHVNRQGFRYYQASDIQLFRHKHGKATSFSFYNSTLLLFFCQRTPHATREVYHVPASSSALVPRNERRTAVSLATFLHKYVQCPTETGYMFSATTRKTASNMLLPCNLVHASARVHTR
jgi:hypothetical protein